MFVWDLIKARTNIVKHGVSFPVASGVFFDSKALDVEAPDEYGERRLKRLGRGFDGRILLVVYTIRNKLNGEETIRIISARQASKKERKAYAGP